MSILLRHLKPGDEAVLAQLATDASNYEEDGVEATATPLPPADAAALLADDRTFVFVALVDGEHTPAGYVVVNEILHWHTFTRMLLVYEIGVARDHRRRGIGRALLETVRVLAVERRIPEGFVLTSATNAPAMGLYAAAGAKRLDVVQWDFDY